MKLGSLFSGIGGIEYGFEQEGFTTAWMVEKEPYAQTILAKRFPQATLYEDVTLLDFRTVPKIDILTGGFPCQDISNAGKRVGIKGARSGLWVYFAKAIRILRPRFVLIENVSALINRGLHVVLANLAKIGYDAEWYCIPASAIGAPHQRDRVFILAYPDKCGQLYRQAQKQSTKGGEQAQCEFRTSSEDVENSECLRNGERSRITESEREKEEKQADKFISGSKKRTPRQAFTSGYWAVEPDVGRVAYGVPFRVDRIKCLGNAVVPQVAQIFAKAIKQAIGGG